MPHSLCASLANSLADARSSGAFKDELILTSPQAGRVHVQGRGELLNLCANNYLGLANHPEVVAAAIEAVQRWGFGMASVRFICGTQTVHRELEERLASFLGTEEAILFGSCFDANTGLFEALLGADDAVISDALNHASVIDGIRLCKARRFRYANGDMGELENCLKEAAGARYRLIATDGVFSMDGYFAKLDAICDLAARYDALVMIDDSHAVGFMGADGRGTHELYGVMDRVDIITGTLGKAMGGASGGYVAGRRDVVEYLRQRSRPYLFSNSVAPAIAAASLTALEIIMRSSALRRRLHENAAHFRSLLTGLEFDILPGSHPIVPIMIGDERAAARFSRALLDRGVYAVSFSHPVVPIGKARIRAQISAVHTKEDLEFAATQFDAARRALED
jgi:glycine C-acetyltransferase